MLPIVITASAFQQSEKVCLQNAASMIKHFPEALSGILIDQVHEPQLLSSDDKVPISYFTLSEWLDENLVPLAVTIKTKASHLSANQMIVLDARYHDPQVISAVLHVVSQTWVHLKTWQLAFVLIVDDFYSTRFVRELADTFYILPLSFSKETLHAAVKRIHLRAQFLRWLGLGRFSRWVRAIYMFAQKLKRYAKRQFSS